LSVCDRRPPSTVRQRHRTLALTADAEFSTLGTPGTKRVRQVAV
jgi:hypothetical protein